MSIEFPCPEPSENMTPNANGAFCHSCNKPLTDITSYSQVDKEEFSKANPNTCVIDLDDESETNWFSTRKFALALLIAGSATLFSFSEPKLGVEIDNLRETLITETTNDSIPLTIQIENQRGNRIDGDITIELPNGKILIPEYNSETKDYQVHLPKYCQSKSLAVYIQRGNKKQSKKITIQAQAENLLLVKFRTKKQKPVKRGKVVMQGRFL